ncbi:MAG: putative DNA binding domain-containing protein [Bacteroidales bacterium]|nr:putative DNA binding domain-containing protein [Bacteroidales bacterium]
MNALELLDIIGKGETSQVQFKANVTNEQSIAQEMVAFANTKGGTILIGVDDKTWDIIGLTDDDLRRLTNLLVNASSQHVKEPIFIETDTIEYDGKKVLIVSVPEGIAKPYKDNDGVIFMKNGANKRKVTSNEEISRLLQSSGYLYAEEKVINHSTIDDVNTQKFKSFYEAKYKETIEAERIEKYLQNLRLSTDDKITIAGALLFGDKIEKLIPAFFITAIWFRGNDITNTEYRSSKNLTGTLDELYREGFDFIVSKLDSLQAGQSFNSIGKLEVPEIVITELLVNALIHRDYFINDSIKIFVFDNRIEIISPGKLPNSLTEEQVRRGVRRTRNTIIASFAPDILEYRGAGSGVLRALQEYPSIDFINDIEGEQFKVIIPRPEKN